MKQILITGVNSYIGNAVERYLMEYNASQGRECYRVDKVSLREDSWESMSFAPYDTIFHVAGIAHADIGGVSEETKALYYQINCDLAVKAAKKAKAEGVPQFIYVSSVIVYGDSAKVGENKHITADVSPAPANFYGDSKWQAEQQLQQLDTQWAQENARVTVEQVSEEITTNRTTNRTGTIDAELNREIKAFHVARIRPPMIYGKGSKGNFPMLVKLAQKAPFFPNIDNKRSMLYVENLGEFVRLLVDSGKGGVFYPQNAEYVTTSQMVQVIGAVKGKKIALWKGLNPFVKLAAKIPGKIGGLANKAFGSLTIEQELSHQEIQGYQIYSLEESIQRSLL